MIECMLWYVLMCIRMYVRINLINDFYEDQVLIEINMCAYYLSVISRGMYTNFYKDNEINNIKGSVMASELAGDVSTRPRSGWTVVLCWKKNGRPNRSIVARPIRSLMKKGSIEEISYVRHEFPYESIRKHNEA